MCINGLTDGILHSGSRSFHSRRFGFTDWTPACRRSHVPPLGSDEPSLDPLMPETVGFVRLAGVMAALACLIAASVLAIVTSETKRR
jgi:hypothetical protein